MSEKRFSFGAVSPNIATIKENGNPLNIGEIVDILNNQNKQIRQLEEENRELIKKVFLFEKGITIYLQKEEQMDLYTYVDLEMKRWRFDNE